MEVVGENWPMYLRVHLTTSMASLLPGATEVLEVAGATQGQQGTLDMLHRKGLAGAAKQYFRNQMWALWLAIPLVIIWVVRMFGAGLGGMRKMRLRMSASAWLMLLIVCVAILMGGPAATPRFRQPVEPLLSVAAAVGLVSLGRRGKGRRRATDAGQCG